MNDRARAIAELERERGHIAREYNACTALHRADEAALFRALLTDLDREIDALRSAAETPCTP